MSASLSIVIPCFDEADGLAQLDARLTPVIANIARERAVEVVLVDDGSRDATPEVLRRRFAARPEFRVVRHEKNRGLGAAMRTGFAAARGEVVVTMDADCTYAPEMIPALAAPVLHDLADLATASPYHPQGAVVGVQPWRLALSLGLSHLYSLAVPRSVRVHTYTSLFRAYRREVLAASPFQADDYVAVAEVLLRALRSGFRVAEMPAVLERRRFGQSKLKVIRTIRRHLGLFARLLLFERGFSGRKDSPHAADPHRPEPRGRPVAGAAPAS
jgi:dolichol-phosphate mannosyltransferase